MRYSNIRVNKAYWMPEPEYRWRVTVYGYAPVDVVAKDIAGAMEQASQVFGLPKKAMNRRASYVLLGPADEEKGEDEGRLTHETQGQ